MNIAGLLFEVSKEYATKTAVIENSQEITYKDLWNTIERLSAAFYKIGIREHHRVALVLPNSKEFIYCFFALLKINAIVSPLSSDLTPYELKTIFYNLNPHAIISLSIFIDKVLSEFPTLLDNKICILQGSVSKQRQSEKYYKLSDLLRDEERQQVDIRTEMEATATINYTYRGLGYPLGAMLNHKNYVEGVVAYTENTRMSSQHRVLSLLPWSHVYPVVGCMLAPLISGATIVLLRNYMPRSILRLIVDWKINHITLVPSVYKLMLQAYRKGEFDLQSLTCNITGGSYMSLEVQETIKAAMGFDVLQGYGLTECLPVTWNRYEYNKAGTLGLPLRSDFHIKIVEDDETCKAANEIGEILVQAPTVMNGYYNRKDETSAVLKDGWLSTGDYGYLDEQGYLYFTGIKKNVVKVGGNMVDLKEVENVLLSHTFIAEATVYGKEDNLWGHVVAAEIVTHENSIDANEVKSYCAKLLSRYKVPRIVKIEVKVAQI